MRCTTIVRSLTPSRYDRPNRSGERPVSAACALTDETTPASEVGVLIGARVFNLRRLRSAARWRSRASARFPQLSVHEVRRS